MQRKNFFISLGFALRGLREFFRSELHAIYHSIAAIVVVIAGIVFQVTRYEWLFLVLAISLVFLTEVINTLLERFMDLVHPGQHIKAGQVKDMAASAVLVATVTAIVIGIVVFTPYIRSYLF